MDASGFQESRGFFHPGSAEGPALRALLRGACRHLQPSGGRWVSAAIGAWPKAKAAAMQALDIDDSLAEAHNSLGLVKEHFEWDWTGTEQEFKRAIELNPNLATAHHWYGDYLTNMGRFEEGMAQTKKAQELDPLSLIINTTLGWQF